MQKQARAADTRRRLIAATEQLVAEWGIEAVNLRDVGREAEQRNNSVVQYHFGTKEILVDAVIDARLPALTDRYRQLAGELASSAKPVDSRAAADVLVTPFLELAGSAADRAFLGFLASVLTSHHWHATLDEREDYQALLDVLSGAARTAGTPASAAARQVRMAWTLIAVTLATRIDDDLKSVRSELIDAIGGILGVGAKQLTGSGKR